MIYIINKAGTDHYKIGFTDGNVEKRLKNLQTGNDHKLTITATLDGDETREAELHRLFWQHHIQGEWFELDTDTLERILNNGERYLSHQSSIVRITPHDVRPIFRRHVNPIAGNRKDVSYRRKAIDITRNQHPIITGGGKHQKCVPSIFRKKR